MKDDDFNYDEIAERVSAKISRSHKVKSILTNEQRQMLSDQLGGITPMQLLMSIARDEEEDVGARVEAAKILMPYVHKKMPVAMENINPVIGVINISKRDLEGISDEEINAALAVLDKMGIANESAPVPTTSPFIKSARDLAQKVEREDDMFDEE